MAAFAFLIIGIVCALISRVLLFMAALRVSGGWAVGVLLPFGPVLFGLNYREEARRSRLFRFATLPCLFLYILMGPGLSYKHQLWETTRISAQPAGYGLERPKAPSGRVAGAPGPTVELTPNIDQQRLANSREFEHLRRWGEALRLKKRDLLHSDTNGNIAYAAEVEQYNAALTRANADRAALWPAAH